MSAASKLRPPKNVLYMNAKPDVNGKPSENLACVLPVEEATPHDNPLQIANCSGLPERYFMDTSHDTELYVVNRKFLADYIFTITGTKIPPQPIIRNLQEAPNLTLGTASLLAPPAKGGINVLSQRNAADIFPLLLDENLAEQPLASLKSDTAEIDREANQLRVNLEAVDATYSLLTTRTVADPPVPPNCDEIGGKPDFPDVADSAC